MTDRTPAPRPFRDVLDGALAEADLARRTRTGRERYGDMPRVSSAIETLRDAAREAAAEPLPAPFGDDWL